MAFIYQYKKTLYFNLQKNKNLHELLYIYIYNLFNVIQNLLLLYNFLMINLRNYIQDT